MEIKPLIILGSSRKDSNTKKLVTKMFSEGDIDLTDLLDFQINHYNYSGKYPETDDFLKVVDKIIKFPIIIFATPVYWYAMSGILKVFFDRLTDIVTHQKNLGRKLKGKKIFLIVSGTDKELPFGFETPFRLTANYLEMNFVSSFYSDSNYQHFSESAKSDFLNKIKNNS